jgi:HD domain-containing protein
VSAADRRGRGIESGGEAAIERDLDDRRRQTRVPLARRSIRASRGAGERVALTERVEYLAADAPRGVGPEWHAVVSAIASGRLDQSEHAPRDEVLAISAAAAGIERARRDRPGESEVRDDAFVARLQIHSSLPGGTVSMHEHGVNNAVTGLSTIAESYFRRYRYPDWLRTHSLLVGAIAARLAEAHAAAGADLDVRTVALGGYLHDIGRSPLLVGDMRDHSVLGPVVLAAEGLPELAELARRHPVYAPRDLATAPRTLAEKIVYYADRRGGLGVVTLEERIDEQVVRFPGLAPFRASDLAMARAIEADICAGIALRPGDLG